MICILSNVFTKCMFGWGLGVCGMIFKGRCCYVQKTIFERGEEGEGQLVVEIKSPDNFPVFAVLPLRTWQEF